MDASFRATIFWSGGAKPPENRSCGAISAWMPG
jgi:hypothetical protein